jgi:hypothetical protein
MGKRGPAPKPKEEKSVIKTFSCPPDVWAEVEANIPTRERSAIIQVCLKREAAQRARQKKRDGAE